MYNYGDLNVNAYVFGTDEDGVKRVKTSKYAFITDRPFAEYVVNRECDLTLIEDRDGLFDFGYAIAVRKGLAFKNVISEAIRHLENNGRIRNLKDKYWKINRCNIMNWPRFGIRPYEFYHDEIQQYLINSACQINILFSNFRYLFFIMLVLGYE